MHVCVSTYVCEVRVFMHVPVCCNQIKQREDWIGICDCKYSLILHKIVVKAVTFCGMMQVWCGVSWRRRRVYVCDGEG
jgi:hypothetical protein